MRCTMKKYLLLLLIIGALWIGDTRELRAQEEAPAQPSTGNGLSLDECIRIASESNRQVLIVDEAANQAAGRLAEARSRLYPGISAGVTYRRVDEVQSFEVIPGKTVEIGSLNNYGAELSVKQPVYMGGCIRAAIRSAEKGQLLQGSQKDDLMRGLTFQIKKAYYDILLNEAIVSANKTSEEVIGAHLADVAAQNRQGLASNYDVLRSQVQLANIRTLRIQSESTLQRSRLTLVSIMGLPLDQADGLTLADKLIYTENIPALSGLEDLAFGNRPDLRSAQLKVDLQGEAVRMAKAENLPSFSLGWNYGEEKPSRKVFGGSEWGDYWNFTAVLSIPIFEGGRVKAKVRQEQSALQQSELALADVKERIRLELAQSILALKDALALIISQKENVKQAEEGVRLVEIGYKNGVNTQLEVLDAQMAADTAAKNYAQALYLYNLAQASLDSVIGK